MAEIIGLTDYPLTGARGRQHDQIAINPGGMLMDRILVMYGLDPKGDGWRRVGQKQFPSLAQFEVSVDHDSIVPGFTIKHGDDDEWLAIVNDEERAPTIINEFDDQTPVIQQSYHVSRWICWKLGIPDDLLHLGQKPFDWQRGIGRDPATSRLAPLHVVTRQSLEHAKSLIDGDKVSPEKIEAIGVDRLRPNIVVEASEHAALSELKLRGLKVGNLTLVKARDTERCPVPGRDQLTGQKMSDLPHAYKRLPQSADDNPLLGAYFYPLIEEGQEKVIAKGDKVEFVFD